MIQVGLTAVVDSQGGLPVFSQCLDGQRNGRRAIAEQFQLMQQHVPLPPGLLMISDRGTYSADHVSRLYRHGFYALCSMRWHEYQDIYDAHADQLHWQPASFLSIEQRRRRQTSPCHANTTGSPAQTRTTTRHADPFPAPHLCYSSANEKHNRERRNVHIARSRPV
jgi:hypothetical protein